MKKRSFIFLFSDNQDLLEISEKISDSIVIDLNLNYIKLIKKLLENKKKSKIKYIVADNSIKGELSAIFLKAFEKNSNYSIWFEDLTKTCLVKKIVELPAVYFSKSLITRSNQMKHSLNLKYKKKVFVVFPWVKENSYNPDLSNHKKTSFKVFTNYTLRNLKNWTKVNEISKSDLSILKLENKLLNFKFPKIIIESIENRTPTIIIYHKPKTVNKIFKYVKNIHVFASESDLDFYHLEYLANQNFKFKIPKKLRFKYNLSNFKKFMN